MDRASSQPAALQARERDTSRTLFLLSLVALTALAFVIRFYRLADLPPGLHYDEAFNGQDTLPLVSLPISQWPIFFVGNFGREPLLNYLLVLAQAIAGPSILTLRFFPALIGALLTPALMWLGWEIAPALGADRRRLALWAGGAVLALLWSQIFARFALRIEFLALLLTLFYAAACRGWRTHRLRWFAAAGVVAGLAFYTYLPVRLLPVALLPVGLLLMLRHRSDVITRRKGIAILITAALIVAAPLGSYFVVHPDAFTQRAGQVSILDQPKLLLDNAVAVAKMFFVVGDENLRSNIPHRPALDWLLVGPFLIGLLVVVRHALRPAHLMLLSWFSVMLLPTVLSEYAPSFQRAIGALPVVALFIAIGLDRLVQWVGRLSPVASRVTAILASALLLASIAITWQAFMAWTRLPELYFARDVGFVTLAAQLKATPAEGLTYISPRGSDHPTLHYLSGNSLRLLGFNGAVCVRLPESSPARYIFLSREDVRGPQLIAELLPDAAARVLIPDPYGEPWALEMTHPADGRVTLQGMQPSGVAFEDGMELLGYWVSDPSFAPGGRVYVRLFWRATATPTVDYTTFVHLLAQGTDGALTPISGADAQPGQGSCNTTSWQPGEIIVDEVQFVVPENASSRLYTLEVGMYDLATGARAPRADGQGDVAVLSVANSGQ